MKKLLTLCVLTLSTMSFGSCELPSEKFVSLEDVQRQFLTQNGTVNWSDQCLEVSSVEENIECNAELDAWDEWLVCEGLTK